MTTSTSVTSDATPDQGPPPTGVAITLDVSGTSLAGAVVTPAAHSAPTEEPDPKRADLPAKRNSADKAEPTSPAEEAINAESVPANPAAKPPKATNSILTVDIGGTKVKILATGQTEPRKAPTGKTFTPARLVETIRGLAHDWDFDAISIGYPGLVGPHGPRSEPGNLGPGWVGFDFAAAFGVPVKMINDAAMQALGSYEGGRMLFLGLGTGLGSCLIAGHLIIPLELGHLMFDNERKLGEVLGRRGLERAGKRVWREAVNQAVAALSHAFIADYVVIGGGNAKNIKELSPGARRGHNLTAFRGGFRLWSVEDVWVMATVGGDSPQPTTREALRML